MLRNLWSEFKSFAFKGNMIDLAVAVVIGTAFSAVINSLVKDIIMPSISYVVTAANTAGKAMEDVAEVASSKVGLTTKPSTQSALTQPALQATLEPATQAASCPTTQPAVAIVVAPPAPPVPVTTAIAAPAGEEVPDKPVEITLQIGRIKIGNFIAELLNFIIIAFAVFIIIVKLIGSVMKKVAGGTPTPSEATMKECPECLSVIPIRAKRCAHCTAVVTPADLPSTPA